MPGQLMRVLEEAGIDKDETRHWTKKSDLKSYTGGFIFFRHRSKY